jgi:SNF2 family DNA or RNA helicase
MPWEEIRLSQGRQPKKRGRKPKNVDQGKKQLGLATFFNVQPVPSCRSVAQPALSDYEKEKAIRDQLRERQRQEAKFLREFNARQQQGQHLASRLGLGSKRGEGY